MPVMGPKLVKNFFTGPATRAYPAVKRPAFPQGRGRILYDAERCTYCGICAGICPAAAITMEEDRENLAVRRVFNSFACIYCGRCVELCPNGALQMGAEHPEYAGAKAATVSSSRQAG
ncbi:MAG: 4Fe-4S dicluster domain-containing protein [Bacillota bacterium]|uniref:4Fe-4S dicluster domain-containing protein n=1 Tax=Desulforudis sp. DRI-14 TaxID=3459793 RepID=UPI00347B6D00